MYSSCRTFFFSEVSTPLSVHHRLLTWDFIVLSTLVLIMLHSIPRIRKTNVRWSLFQSFPNSKLEKEKHMTFFLFTKL